MNITLRIANYIARYAPSKKKITEYLQKKKYSGDIDTFLKEIQYDETLLCGMWVSTFLAQKKGEREMKMKLMKKGFPKDMIKSTLMTSLGDIRDWEEYARDISLMIEDALRKGKSKEYIRMTFSGKYPYFRDEIASLLEESSDTDGLEKEIKKYQNKYHISDPKEKQKFYAALQRKGFRYGDIRYALADHSIDDSL